MKARALVIGIALVLAVPVAAEERRGGHQRGGVERQHGGGGGHHYRGRRPDPFGQLGGAIVGGVIGGAISNWLAPPPPRVIYVPPAPIYVPPVVVYQAPPPEIIEIDPMAPFQPDWYTYCADKYRSFDAKTGYYTSSIDGVKRFCKVD